MKINHDIARKSSAVKAMRQFLRRRNPVGYLVNRARWHMSPRLSLLSDYPIHVDIELSSRCQLKCPMCFRFHRKVEHQGDMPFDLFKKIIDEISGKVDSIKFTGRGEPLMQPEFKQFMEYIGSKQFAEVAIISNGLLMTEDIMVSMIEQGMDRVAFSVDGLRDKYEEIRAPGRYEDIISIVSKLFEVRSRLGADTPSIRIQGVKTSIDEEQEFLETWDPISDEILFLEYKDYSGEAESQEQAAYRCPLLYQRLMIHWDGTVPMCINDEYEDSVMGSVEDSSVHEIWRGDNFDKARRIHKEGHRGDVYANCSKCALHRKGHGKS